MAPSWHQVEMPRSEGGEGFSARGSLRTEETFTDSPESLPCMSLPLELGHLPILDSQTIRRHEVTIGSNKVEPLPQGGMWEGDIRPELGFC